MADDGIDDVPNGTEDAAAAFRDVPIVLTISVGRAKAAIGTLLSLDRNAVLPLDRGIEDPVTIYAGDRIVAYGELQEAEGDPPGRLAVRITEVAPESDGG